VAATTAPVVLIPAMNDAMWNHRAVQRNVKQLKDDGMYVVEPTLIFGAADVPAGAEPMFGGHGTLWAGPRGLMRAVDGSRVRIGDAGFGIRTRTGRGAADSRRVTTGTVLALACVHDQSCDS